MADYTFFFNPQSRSRIARWALHEAGADYEGVLVRFDEKPQALLDANPMGKLPTIIHHATDGDRIVTEAAAVCHYLAETEARDLLPEEGERADYFRWLFFAAGPVEQAVTAKNVGWEVPEDKQIMVGFGDFERTLDTFDQALAGREWVCGDRFTMADVYVGSAVEWGLFFGSLPERDNFLAYCNRIAAREAYKSAKAIDDKMLEENDEFKDDAA